VIVIPDRLAQNIVEVYGGRGVTWLRQLPALVNDFSLNWSVVVRHAYNDASYSYVAPGVRSDGVPVVLKLAVPDASLIAEEQVLRWYDGSGAVRVLQSDPARGALLLEHIEPGHSLVRKVQNGRDDEATLALAGVMGRMWRVANGDAAQPELRDIAQDTAAFPELGDRYAGGTGSIPSALVDRAQNLAAELLRSPSEQVLLHADLHHGNVLRSEERGWLAIDPKGRIGEPECEVAALLRNPLPELAREPNLRKRLERRIDILQEVLQLRRERMLAWAFVLTAVSLCWQLEDHAAVGDDLLEVLRILGNCR